MRPFPMAPSGDAVARQPPETAAMYIVHHAHLSSEQQGGIRRLVAADHRQGIRGFEVWMLTLEPGAATQELRHAGELIAVALQGCGKLLVDGGPQRFQAPSTLVVPPDTVFQLANNGSIPLEVAAVFTRAPVVADAG